MATGVVGVKEATPIVGASEDETPGVPGMDGLTEITAVGEGGKLIEKVGVVPDTCGDTTGEAGELIVLLKVALMLSVGTRLSDIVGVTVIDMTGVKVAVG